MNQGRIWCVVHPTVGLPLLLGSVAVTSLIVHASIMTHTTWMSTYWMGKAARVASLNTGASQTAMATSGTQAVSVKVTPVPATSTSQASFTITVSPAPATPAASGLIHTASAN